MIYCTKCSSNDVEISKATELFYCYNCGYKERIIAIRESKLQELFNSIDELKRINEELKKHQQNDKYSGMEFIDDYL